MFTHDRFFDPEQTEMMRGICHACPLLELCRTFAIAGKPTAGMWAGMTPAEIRHLGTQQPPLEERERVLRPWTAYLADTLADEPMRLGREERQELVGYLSGEGLSRAAIATAVDVPERTIQRDFRAIEKAQVETDVSPPRSP